MVDNSPPPLKENTRLLEQRRPAQARTSRDRRTDIWTLHRVKNTVQAGEPGSRQLILAVSNATPPTLTNSWHSVKVLTDTLRDGSLSWPGPALDPRPRRYSPGCTAGSLGAGAPRHSWWRLWDLLPSGQLPEKTVKALLCWGATVASVPAVPAVPAPT